VPGKADGVPGTTPGHRLWTLVWLGSRVHDIAQDAAAADPGEADGKSLD